MLMGKTYTKIIVYILFFMMVFSASFFAMPQGVSAAAYSQSFGLTGSYQEFTAPESGKYLLEVYGAQDSGGGGGGGGYAKGVVMLSAGQKLYIFVGGKNGYNGGGSSYYTHGGGATDIRTTLGSGAWNDWNGLSSRIIVAGGAGGYGGYGGGTTGGSTDRYGSATGGGGTQTSGGAVCYSDGKATAGSFGQGGNSGGGFPGGGGWYGGGGGGYASSRESDTTYPGGGGSGYLNTSWILPGTGGMLPGICTTDGSARITELVTDSYSSFSQTFSYTGSYQTFTVPATGIYNITAVGASGGGSAGGQGGMAYGTVYLYGGQTLYVYVGGQGGLPNLIPKGYMYGHGGGGWNGGGDTTNCSGSLPVSGSPAIGYYFGYGGGGASDIRFLAGNLSSRLIVAGGGGGGTTAGHAGGAGGGLTGNDSETTSGYDPFARSTHYFTGHGGTNTAGGTIGGAFGQGGTASQCGYSSSYGWEGGGGGGGGGWYGGGGGDGGAWNLGASAPVSGGGGGSGYAGGIGVTNGSTTAGGNTGNGYVTITRSATANPTAPTITSPLWGATTSGNPTITWNFSDPTIGAKQSAFAVRISNDGGASWMYDSGVQASNGKSFTIPSTLSPGNYNIRLLTWLNDPTYADPPPASGYFTVANPPNPATNLQITGVTASSISASWSANGNSSGTIYNLVLQDSSNGQWLQNPEITNTAYTFTELQANVKYNVWVKVRNTGGLWATTDYQLIGTPFTLANAPGSPSYGTITQTSMALNWNINGNSSSTQYFAAVVPNGADPEVTTNWKANSGWTTNVSTWTATGLLAGTQYHAYVKATNADGVRTSWTDFGAKWTLQGAPIINITSPPGYTPENWTNSNVKFTITVGAGVQKIQYSLNNGKTWNDYTSEATISTQGITTILAQALDNAGNISPNASATIKIDTTAPTINPTESPIDTTPDPVTVTTNISDNASGIAVQKWAEGNQNEGYFASGGTTFAGQTFMASANGTYTIYAKDNVGNEAVNTIIITNIHIYPILNIPTITGSIYLGEDVTLVDTGTNIDYASYRVYYTTDVLAPTITNGNDPGAGWVDSGITGSMAVTGGTDIAATILGKSLSNNNWTYVTFKVWAASSTNDSVTQYSQSYMVSNDGNSAINYVGYNQKIKIFNTGKDIIVSDPDTPVQAYKPDPTSVGYLSQNNVFENENPFMKYRLEFDVLKPQIVKDIEIDFDFNYYNNYWIEFRPKTMILEKLNDDGTVVGILQTYNLGGLAYSQQSTNRYVLKLGNDNEGNSIIQANGVGRYAVEYAGELIVQTDNRGGTVIMKNNAQIYVYTTTSIYPDTLEVQRPSRKFYIDTKVTKFDVRYH